jgi:hypothetical protein
LLSVCVCLCIPPIVARQRLGKKVSALTNIHATIKELSERVVFYAVRVVSKESRELVLPRTYCFTSETLVQNSKGSVTIRYYLWYELCVERKMCRELWQEVVAQWLQLHCRRDK